MVNGARSVSGCATVQCANRQARFLSITFPERGQIAPITLKIGPGDHTCDRWEIDRDQLRLIVLDSLPWLLG